MYTYIDGDTEVEEITAEVVQIESNKLNNRKAPGLAKDHVVSETARSFVVLR